MLTLWIIPYFRVIGKSFYVDFGKFSKNFAASELTASKRLEAGKADSLSFYRQTASGAFYRVRL